MHVDKKALEILGEVIVNEKENRWCKCEGSYAFMCACIGKRGRWGNSCIDLVLFAEYSEQKCKSWEHLERGKMGEEVVVVSALLLALYQAYMHTRAHSNTPLMCEGSLGSQSAALNKASLFLPLIAGSICHRGVQFLISALTESSEVGVGKNTKWMHLLTNEIKPLHLHFPFFRQLEQCCCALALRTLSYY